jgi:hypothetical protein
MRVDKVLGFYSSFMNRRGLRLVANEWFLEFNPPSYNILQITHKRT